jgi:hypothetical protein
MQDDLIQSKNPATVIKDGSWWNVERDGVRLLSRINTKKLAVLTKRMFDGDASAAPEWYRLTLTYERKAFPDEAMALRSTVLAAKTLGLRPDHVRADPDTGKPID